MGSAISRCTTREHGVTSSGLGDIGQKILDNQPNWLITPSRWRSRHCDHQPVRYRTPTPYPKDDRRPLPPPQQVHVNISEKPLIVETQTVATKHIEVVEPPRREKPMQSNLPHIQLPPAALSITWERHSRRNRFERIA